MKDLFGHLSKAASSDSREATPRLSQDNEEAENDKDDAVVVEMPTETDDNRLARIKREATEKYDALSAFLSAKYELQGNISAFGAI